MELASKGAFSLTIEADKLKRGLRPSIRTPRNMGFLVSSIGAIGRDGVLQSLDSLERLDTSVITDAFPYPQIFVFTNLIIVCGSYNIYELVSGSLVLKYTASKVGTTWVAVDFFEYIYLSNGSEAVIRDASTKTYSISYTQPFCTAMCNYNGQVVIGGADSDAGELNTIFSAASDVSVTLSLTGTMTLEFGDLLTEDGKTITTEGGDTLIGES